MTTSPGVQERALLYSASTGASSRASTRPDSRPSPGSRSRGGPVGREEGGEASPPRKQGSAREGEGRAHRPVAGSAGRGRPERRGRGSARSRTPHRSGRLGGRRHRQQQPTVAVIRSASASTSRAATSSGRDPVVLGGDAAGRATVVDATPAE